MTLTRWLGLLGVGCFLFLLYSLSSIALPFLAGCIGAYALDPFVTALERHGINRSFATIIIMIFFIAFIALFFMLVIPAMHRELLAISHSLPHLSEKLLTLSSPLWEEFSRIFGMPTLSDFKTHVSSHVGDIAQVIVNFLINIIGNGMLLANIISLLILTPVVMFYFLKDWKKFIHNTLSLVPRSFVGHVKYYAIHVDKMLKAYAKGQIIVCISLMMIYTILLSLIHLPDAIFIGCLTGFLAFIPYLGALIGLILSLIVGFISFNGWGEIIAILVIFFVVSLIEGNFLTPKLIGKKVGLHPIWILFSLLAAATWFGFMGAIIALPVAAIIGTIVRLLLEEYYNTRFYKT